MFKAFFKGIPIIDGLFKGESYPVEGLFKRDSYHCKAFLKGSPIIFEGLLSKGFLSC